MSNDCLMLSNNLELIIFSGKGGVGKTTCASAAALYLAKRGQKTLLASTDPAHSLVDSLALHEGRAGNIVSITDNLKIMEIDAIQILEEFKQEHGEVMKEIANRGTYFDRDDINDFFSLSLPGLDELMSIIKLMEFLEADKYDVIVLDTAPTGHTIRLLSLPDHMGEWLHVLDLMLEKHRYMASVFSRYVPDDTDGFIVEMGKKVSALKKLITDSTRTQFIPVVIPEAMSINETEKLVEEVQSQGIQLTQIIVNRVVLDRECTFCRSRRTDQANSLLEIDTRFKAFNRVYLPLMPQEIKGISALIDFSKRIFNNDEQPIKADASTQVDIRVTEAMAKPFQSHELIKKKFILIGGKGGVGKTSIAAATGLYLANMGKKTLVFSTDPAHSLTDSFGCSIGNQITPLSESIQLYGLEISSQKMLDNFREQYVEEITEVFDGFVGGTGIDVAFDKEVMTELISLMPPGIDEIMALMKLMELSDKENYDVIILDTAPTGHLIRMLELPELARKWFYTFFRLVLKYEGVVNLQKTTDLILKMYRGVRKVQSDLTAADQTSFLGVTNPEAMVVKETERLLSSINKLGINSSRLVINMVIPPNQCYFCSQKRIQQQSYIEELRMKYLPYKMVEIPLFSHEVKGIENLMELSRLLID